MTTAITTALPKPIADELEKLNGLHGRLMKMVDDVRFAQELINEFEGKVPGTKSWYVSVGVRDGLLQGITIHVTAKDFRELVTVRRHLREIGFPAPEVDDFEAIGRRSWEYKREGHETFRLSAHTSYEEGAACRYVEVGKKEEPIYELRCDGQPLPEEVEV